MGTVIVIDVYRAFTTAAVAFSRGARKIILVAEIEEALGIRQRGQADICVGEVDGMKPPEFDFGNSPFELSEADLEGKTIVQSTRAGTVGVVAAGGASQIFLGSLAVAQATVSAVLGGAPDVVTIVAMGGAATWRTDEDEQCALYLRNVLEGRKPDKESVRKLVLAGGESQKFGDPALPHFHAEDRDFALDFDRYPFSMPVTRENGLLTAYRRDG